MIDAAEPKSDVANHRALIVRGAKGPCCNAERYTAHGRGPNRDSGRRRTCCIGLCPYGERRTKRDRTSPARNLKTVDNEQPNTVDGEQPDEKAEAAASDQDLEDAQQDSADDSAVQEEESERIQHHPAFTGAVKIELSVHGKDVAAGLKLRFITEKAFARLPFQSDLVVEKKEPGLKLTDAIGSFLEDDNVMDYKSPEDTLDYFVLCKIVSYAFLLANERRAKGDWVPLPTVTIMRYRKPAKLFDVLKKHGAKVREHKTTGGIYYIEDWVGVPIQIVVTRELPKDLYPWLGALAPDQTEDELEALAHRSTDFQDIPGGAELDLHDSAEVVQYTAVNINIDTVRRMQEEDPVAYQALRQLMAPEWDMEHSRMQAVIKTQGAQIKTQATRLKTQGAQIKVKDAQIKVKDAQIEEKDAQLAAKDEQIEAKDAQIEEKDAQLAEKDEQIEAKDAHIERDQQRIAYLESLLKERAAKAESDCQEKEPEPEA